MSGSLQGTSASSLDVLTSVTSEFLLNVGRTLRFLCDKYAKTMTPEVRYPGLLHMDANETLFSASMLWKGY